MDIVLATQVIEYLSGWAGAAIFEVVDALADAFFGAVVGGEVEQALAGFGERQALGQALFQFFIHDDSLAFIKT